jgi:glutathione synthase/RimK-type ligase-like ATP-grasp enzyme
MTILVVTDQHDKHADHVIGKLLTRDLPVFRLNLDVDSLKETIISYHNGKWRFKVGSAAADAENIKCVWCRRSTVSLDLEQQTDSTNALRMWRSEWNRVLFGFYNALSGARWLNHLRDATLADNKYYQYIVARSCGLKCPEILSSNNKEELLEFANRQGEVALKFMSQELYTMDNGAAAGLYVNKITTEQLSDFSEYGENPITLQPYIKKLYEVRYTFVDGKHLACKIESQRSSRASTDWRRYDVANTPHEAISAPTSISEKVANLMKALNLSFGALDFIVDRDEIWWFLEVNTNGQWLWIEDLAGLEISDSVATSLEQRYREG